MEHTIKALMSLLMLFLLSCGGDSDTIEPNEVSSERIEVANVTMLPEGGEKQVMVNANCAWVINVPESDTWLSVNPTSGANTQAITISCSENKSTSSRTSVVTISGKQRTTAFKVTQNALEIINITISNFNSKDDEKTSKSLSFSFTLSPVTDDISACGVCFSNTNKKPTINDNIVAGERNSNIVEVKMTNLSPNTTYYVCAFVTNSSGTYYSNVKECTTLSIPGSDDNIPPNE